MRELFAGIVVGLLTAVAYLYIATILGNQSMNQARVGIGGGPPTPTPTLISPVVRNTNQDALSADSRFSTFTVLANNAGIQDELTGPAQYTFFVPVNSAFTSISDATLYQIASDRTTLRAFVRHHMVSGSLSEKDLTTKDSIKMVDGSTVKISNSGKQIGGAKILDSVTTSNGTIYAIDQLIAIPDYLMSAPKNI